MLRDHTGIPSAVVFCCSHSRHFATWASHSQPQHLKNSLAKPPGQGKSPGSVVGRAAASGGGVRLTGWLAGSCSSEMEVGEGSQEDAGDRIDAQRGEKEGAKDMAEGWGAGPSPHRLAISPSAGPLAPGLYKSRAWSPSHLGSAQACILHLGAPRRIGRLESAFRSTDRWISEAQGSTSTPARGRRPPIERCRPIDRLIASKRPVIDWSRPSRSIDG